MDDIIRMAREAGAWSLKEKNCEVEYVMSVESLERFAALVRADEREACAKVCDGDDPEDGSGYSTACEALAKTIRART